MVATSLKPQAYIFDIPPSLIPKEVTTDNYTEALGKDLFGVYFLNSMVVALSTVVLTLVLSSLLAYAFARLDFPAKEKIFYLLLLGMMVPPVMLIIPQFLVAKSLNLLDSLAGLIVVYIAMNVSMQTFLLRGFFETIPRDLEEAALIDGASRWTIMWRIIIPLSLTGTGGCGDLHFPIRMGRVSLGSRCHPRDHQTHLADRHRTFPVPAPHPVGAGLCRLDCGPDPGGGGLRRLPAIFRSRDLHHWSQRMKEIDVMPDRGTYKPGQPVRIMVLAPGHDGASIHATVSHVTTEVANLESRLGDHGRGVLEWSPPPDSPRGYGVDIRIDGRGEQDSLEVSTAFDVLSRWADRPRYGFVTDFGPGRRVEQVVEALLPFHINALQFYDWQYRHDQLVAPTKSYDDPLGRSLSLDTVTQLAKVAKSRGIGAMAYAAVYAASIDFQRDHPAGPCTIPMAGPSSSRIFSAIWTRPRADPGRIICSISASGR